MTDSLTGSDRRSAARSGWGARLVLGLAGAFLGGMVVRATGLDLGWGPVLIRYEELLVSLLGAILLVGLAKFIGSRLRRDNSDNVTR